MKTGSITRCHGACERGDKSVVVGWGLLAMMGGRSRGCSSPGRVQPVVQPHDEPLALPHAEPYAQPVAQTDAQPDAELYAEPHAQPDDSDMSIASI